jgi:hypothetical protein
MKSRGSIHSNTHRYCAAALAGALFVSFTMAKTDIPLFLLSGQSNMSGMGAAVSELSADQKKTVDSVKIYLDMEGDQAKRKKWMPLGPGFGSDGSHFGPELLFGKTLFDSLPVKKAALIKASVSGTYLNQTAGWLPPSSNNGTGGTLYKNMMTVIDAAMKAFTTAFDTAQYTPRWAGFVWLQGEFDAQNTTDANAYEKNLTNLIKDIRAKTQVEDLPVILPMIDVQSMWKYAATVRTADVKMTTTLKNVDTMDTKGLPTDGIHYKAAGMVKIGTICGWRWLNMKYKYSPTVPILHEYAQSSETRFGFPDAQFAHGAVFDLMGRKIAAFSGTAGGSPGRPAADNCFIFATVNKSGAVLRLQKAANLGAGR